MSVLSEAIAPDPELLAGSERLLAELHWTGVAMVEFRRAPTGPAFLMEMNPRLWGSLQLAIDAGVDFPSLLVALHRGAPIPAAQARLGTRTRWLLGDVDHLLICLRRPELRRQLRNQRAPRCCAISRAASSTDRASRCCAATTGGRFSTSCASGCGAD